MILSRSLLLTDGWPSEVPWRLVRYNIGQSARSSHWNEQGHFHLFLAGPAVLGLLFAAVATLLLVLMALGQLPKLTTLTARTAARSMRGRLLPIVWGLAAEFLIAILAVGFGKINALALLGLVVLFLGSVLAGLGACLTARRAGRVLLNAVGEEGEDDVVCSILVGLVALLFAALVPFAGWVVVLLATAAGWGSYWNLCFAETVGHLRHLK